LGRCVSTDPASDLISRGETLLGFCRALEAMVPTLEPDFSLATVSVPELVAGQGINQRSINITFGTKGE
jgi:hypothetical protein